MPTTVVAAAATFAPTSYARARLLRALYGGGLLRSEQCGRAPALENTGSHAAARRRDPR